MAVGVGRQHDAKGRVNVPGQERGRQAIKSAFPTLLKRYAKQCPRVHVRPIEAGAVDLLDILVDIQQMKIRVRKCDGSPPAKKAEIYGVQD